MYYNNIYKKKKERIIKMKIKEKRFFLKELFFFK